ncbi:MAG: xanthine dehydrogenase accessory protein XdhC [Planctomycetota bacterium]
MDESQAWIEKLSELRAAGRACAVVVVTDVQGSVPREPGARMIVADGELAWGTIGGGNLELQAIEHAAGLVAAGAARSESVDYPLSEKVGQCCGGKVTLFFESFPWTRRRIAVFGAGHVAQALGALAPWLQADVTLIDGRDEAEIRPPLPPAGERPYTVDCVDAPEAVIDELAPETLVLVMTHSHALDLDVLERALRREPFPYLGLIGSGRKWERFRKRLAQRGFNDDQIARVTCPIGASKTSKDPRAIAVSTAAELLEVFERLAAERRAQPTRR